MRIILDSNIIVSALLSPHGLPAKVFNLVLNGSVTLIYNNCILSEYINVLYREKFKINKELLNLIIDFIEKEGEYGLATPQSIKFDDEDDIIFYELYRSADVDYLITGNKKHFPNEKGIVNPREFIEKEYNKK